MKTSKVIVIIFLFIFVFFGIWLAMDRLDIEGVLKNNVQTGKTTKTDSLILVNKSNPFYSTPSDLVSVYENKNNCYLVRDTGVSVQKQMMKPLNDMMEAFYKKTKLKTVNVISGYRSVERQQEIYAEKKLLFGKSYADKYVQKPGSSEHHTGLAVDLALYYSENGTSEDFLGTGEYSWFKNNCHKFGFILRYEADKEDITGISFEPWHFRYVGKKAAKYIYENGLCLEEYCSEFSLS
ncbi:MAG: M15 family metallopeptidase [Clostridia bacterium]|nr:M15 family metallopeptidase [Clostridia bacterium]